MSLYSAFTAGLKPTPGGGIQFHFSVGVLLETNKETAAKTALNKFQQEVKGLREYTAVATVVPPYPKNSKLFAVGTLAIASSGEFDISTKVVVANNRDEAVENAKCEGEKQYPGRQIAVSSTEVPPYKMVIALGSRPTSIEEIVTAQLAANKETEED